MGIDDGPGGSVPGDVGCGAPGGREALWFHRHVHVLVINYGMTLHFVGF